MNLKMAFRISCVIIVNVLVSGQSIDHARQLYWHMFQSGYYVKYVRPATDQSQAVTIDTTFVLNSIVDFNEQQGSLTTAGYLHMYWRDPGLTWNTSDFGETRIMFVPQDIVWKPDVTLSNSFTHMQGLGYDQLNVVVANDGFVTWTPLQILTSTCSVDVTYFPFDTQTCAIKFIAWSYRVYEVRMRLPASGMVELGNDYATNSLWTLVDSSSEEDWLDASVTFKLKLERKSSFYVMNIIVPVIMLTVLAAFTFVLPVQSGERASFAVTVFLALAVFLTIVASELPKNSDVTPILGVYLIVMITVSTLIAIVSVLQIRLVARDAEQSPPDINVFYRSLHKFAMILTCKTCIKATPVDKVRVHAAETSDTSMNPSVEDHHTDTPRLEKSLSWGDVIFASDVLLFVLSVSTILIGTMVFFAITVNNPQWSANKYAQRQNVFY